MQAVTGPRVERAMAAYLRRVGLTPVALDRHLGRLVEVLGNGNHLTRPELAVHFPELGGEALGHVLMAGEVRALICSAPSRRSVHTYGLVDELLAPSPVDLDAARTDLVYRFFAGHGPADLDDLVRWAAITKGEGRAALSELGDRLERAEIEGHHLYHDPALQPPRYRSNLWLLHVYDEATLTYPRLNFPRTADNPYGAAAGAFLSDPYAGAILSRTRWVGGWRRRVRAGAVAFELRVAEEHRPEAEQAAAGMARYLGRRLA
jgi:hypothetical protein